MGATITVPALCGDLLGEDAEPLAHPQDGGGPCACGEVAEGQEAAGGCGEGGEAQSSLAPPSSSWGGGTELAGAGDKRELTCLRGQRGLHGVGTRRWDAERLLPAGQAPHPLGSARTPGPGLTRCRLGGTGKLRAGASSTTGPGQRGRHPAEPHSGVQM